MKRIVLSIVLIISGCANEITFSKEGASMQDKGADAYDCEVQTRSLRYFGPNDRPFGFFLRCMQAHGWTINQLKQGNWNR